MGTTNRFVAKWPGEPHHDHIVIANTRLGSFAGKRQRTTILRCFSCDHAGKVLVGLQQNEVHHG